jgi:hypothetical protein
MTEQHSSHFEESFVKFTKHIPRILRKQILSDFVNQLVESNSASTSTENGDSELSNTMVEDPIDMVQETTSVSMNHDPKSCCRPTIERFHGTLLFVDISGFTILSQKLTIDRLRSFINAYFKRLIDIVHKYDGEVIKFAGDALFIIWQTKVNSLGKAYMSFEISPTLFVFFLGSPQMMKISMRKQLREFAVPLLVGWKSIVLVVITKCNCQNKKRIIVTSSKISRNLKPEC